MNIFEGLLGYEKLMLLCGLILFVFALVAITVMIVQRRDFKMAMVLIVFAIVLMGFPGVQAIKFSQDTIELNRIRTQPTAPATAQQQQQAVQMLESVEKRAADNPQLQAQVADGYRAIGDVDKAYTLAQSVLRQKPTAQVQATLVPVLTAKLNQVQAGARIASPPTTSMARARRPEAASTVAPPTSAAAPAVGTAHTPTTATTASASTSPTSMVDSARQREIAHIADQLQATAAPLPASTHAALAKAYVVLGQPQKAKASVDAALKLNPDVRINTAVLQAVKADQHRTRPPER